MTTVRRETRETQIRIRLEPGDGVAKVETAEPFLTHMLETLARYAGLDLEVEAAGDLRHHLVEDVAIALGVALREETPEACARYGAATVPMDDALVQVALDAGGRPFFEGGVPSRLYEHFLQSLAVNAAYTVHVRVIRGRDRHHIVEAAVKALGLALRQALAPGAAVFSTKGAVRLETD